MTDQQDIRAWWDEDLPESNLRGGPVLLWADVPLPQRMRPTDTWREHVKFLVWLRTRDTHLLCAAAVRPHGVSRDCWLQCGSSPHAGGTLCTRHQALAQGLPWPPYQSPRTPWDDLDRRRPLLEQLNAPQLNSGEYLEHELCRALRQIVDQLTSRR